MRGAFRLQAVLEAAQGHLDAVTTELQNLAVHRREAEGNLQQLEGFLAEYRELLRQGLEQGIEPDRLRDFRAFLDKLEQTVALQRAEVKRCVQAWHAVYRRWLELRARRQALSVLQRRHQSAERTREVRGEQQQHDEFTLRERETGPSGRG